MNRFADVHPLVLFAYYLSVLLVCMFTMNPVVLLYALAGGLALFALLTGLRSLLKNLVFYLFLFLFMALINPLFSHSGETILFFRNDKPVTLEAIVYGGAIALMVIGILFWCKNYVEIMTSDKFLFLFARLLPKLALVISMATRFVPLFKEHTKQIHATQKAMGMYVSDSLVDRALASFRATGSLMTWMFENSVGTADSMRARGYGLPRRSSFSIFRFTAPDGILLALIAALSALIWWGTAADAFLFFYYPYTSALTLPMFTSPPALAVLALMLLPAILQIQGSIRWKWLRSKM